MSPALQAEEKQLEAAHAANSVTMPEMGDTEVVQEPPNSERWEEGLSKLSYLSKQEDETRMHWVAKKVSDLREEGNKFYNENEYDNALRKYKSGIDLLGDERWPEPYATTYDDLRCLLYCNMSQSCIMMKSYGDGLIFAEEVLRVDPDSVKAKYRKAKATLNLPFLDAAKLWDLQDMLYSLLQKCCDDKLLDLMEEVYVKAKDKKVKLPPPQWMFPDCLEDFHYSPCRQKKGEEKQLIIYLHDFSSRCEPLMQFAEELNLLDTASLGLNGPVNMELEPGNNESYSWFYFSHDEPRKCTIEGREDSLAETHQYLLEVIECLTSTVGWDLDCIFLFGFGQGATMAIDFMLSHRLQIGGLVSVNGRAFSDRTRIPKTAPPVDAPLLLMYEKESESGPSAGIMWTVDFCRQYGIGTELQEIPMGVSKIEDAPTKDLDVLIDTLQMHFVRYCNRKAGQETAKEDVDDYKDEPSVSTVQD
eukprot:GEMP01041934.1.p1 GENE.GEMP01041934.1~~GEMP01041934.1.p1  ORF type:complete len:474 (+),score=112.40 GEMP01041934.1:307-1728(+)